MTPRSFTDSDSASRDSSSKTRRGWRAFGAIRSTGSLRSSAPGAVPSVGARIAASPRPMPRGRSATRGHLLGEREVGLGPGAVGVVVDDGNAVARRLAQADVARDDGVEHEGREVRTDL